MIRVDVWLPDPSAVLADGAFGAGALIRIERADVVGGPYVEVHTIAIVAIGGVAYQWWDPDGDETSWYRWRVSNADGDAFSPYSDPFAGTNPAGSVLPRSYAPLERLLRAFETRPTKPERLARLGQALGDATDELIREARRDYFRHPATGTAVVLVDGPGGCDLHLHDGIAELELVEVSADGGETFEALDPAAWTLRWFDPESSDPPLEGEPWFHVRLTGLAGGPATWPKGTNAVRLTVARGWPAVPASLAGAVVVRARQQVYAEGSYSGALPGPQEMNSDVTGQVYVSDRWPDAVYRFLAKERSRFMACAL